MKSVLAIDIGTTFIKHAIIGADGSIINYQSIALAYHKQIAHTNINLWFSELIAAIHAIPQEVRASVAAIIISGQGPSLLPILRDGHLHSEVIFRSTLSDAYLNSSRIHHSYYLPFALQYIDTYPQLRIQLKSWLPIPEYFLYRLSGKMVAMLPSRKYDRYYWSRRSVTRVRMRGRYFPSYAFLGDNIAPLSDAMATASGLPAQIPIFSGGLDFCMAIIGSNSYHEYAICDRAGSTEGINFIHWPAAPTHKEHALFKSYPLFHSWDENQSLLIINSGALIDGAEKRDFNALRRFIFNESLKVPPLLPVLKNKGVIKITGPERATGNSRQQQARLLESMLFTIKYALDIFLSTHRKGVGMALCGGQTRLTAWNQLKADVLSLPCFSFQLTAAELLGSAAVAFHALKIYPTLEDAVSAISRIQERFLPHASFESQRYHNFKQRFTAMLASRPHGDL